MFLFGGKKNEPKKIEAAFEEKIKSSVRSKLCPLCNKMQSSKVAFGEGVQSTLTCNNCELKSVGNITQKLGAKNLISAQKFASLLTTELISYQKGQTEPPLIQKENVSLGQALDKKAKEVGTYIKTQMHSLKENSKAKVEELTLQAEKQNAMPIFEEAYKLQSEKKAWSSDFLGEVIRRSLVGSKGVHFIDEQQLDKRNGAIDQRFQALKKETKVKLRNVSTLINDINNIKLE